MEQLLAQANAAEVLAQFGQEDIGLWPFWKRADGYFARGRAAAVNKAGQAAEADFTAALEFTGDPRLRGRIWLARAKNCETALEDDTAALAAYREALGPSSNISGSDEFTALQSIARILSRRGEFDEALATLRTVDVEKLRGGWRGSMLLAVGEILQAAERSDEALALYQSVAIDELVDSRHRQAAEEAASGLLEDDQ